MIWPFNRESDERIIAAVDPWMLACAVGAENGTVGIRIGFDSWFRSSSRNWLSAAAKDSGASEQQIRSALRRFVRRNLKRHMNEVLDAECRRRGLAAPIVLGPGEEVTITVAARGDSDKRGAA